MSNSNKELRRYQRIPFAGLLRICSEDAHGNAVYGRAKCIDLSQGGVRIEALTPISVGTFLSLRSDTLNLGGQARVKQIAQKGAKYFLGLELSQPLSSQTLAAVRPM
jgi:PilZ domain-containing protein